jgi:anti-anti-sigma regulatory factor
LKTPLPTPNAHVVVAPAHITALVLTNATTAAVASVHAGAPAIVVDCHAITTVDANAWAVFATLAQAVILSTATVHLYDVPPQLAIDLDINGKVHLLFSSIMVL